MRSRATSFPPDRINPVARNVLKYYAAAEYAGRGVYEREQLLRAGSGILDIDQIDGRFDHNFTTNQPVVRPRFEAQPGRPARSALAARRLRCPKTASTSGTGCTTACSITPTRRMRTRFCNGRLPSRAACTSTRIRAWISRPRRWASRRAGYGRRFADVPAFHASAAMRRWATRTIATTLS